jgi:hypothetical protein
MEDIKSTDVSRKIDKIDINKEKQEFLDIYYRLQLLHLVKVILYQDPGKI